MEEIILKPKYDDELIVQLSQTFYIEKNVFVTIPHNYIGLLVCDQKIWCKISPVNKVQLYKITGKEKLKQESKIIFVQNKKMSKIQWGFGNINVNNERLKEAYRIGENGSLELEIIELIKFLNFFSWDNDIYVEDIREKIIPYVKNLGISILCKKFANTDISIFEINSKLDEIKKEFLEILSANEDIKKMGIGVSSLIINEIHINEDDMEIIRKRLNKDEEDIYEKIYTISEVE